MFSPRWECSHRGGNVSTSVEILLTAVGMFSPRWECSHHGGNVLTAVGMFSPRWEYFSPRWECSHRGGNVSTAVRMFWHDARACQKSSTRAIHGHPGQVNLQLTLALHSVLLRLRLRLHWLVIHPCKYVLELPASTFSQLNVMTRVFVE